LNTIYLEILSASLGGGCTAPLNTTNNDYHDHDDDDGDVAAAN